MFDAPAATITVNRSWLPYLYGAMVPYTQPDMWQGSEVDQFLASQQVESLLNGWVDASIVEAGMIVSEIGFASGTSSPALIRAVQPLETADECLVTIDTAFDSGSLSIGDDSDPARLLTIADLSALIPGDQIQLSPQYKYPAAADVKVYLTGTPATGSARVTLYSFLEG